MFRSVQPRLRSTVRCRRQGFVRRLFRCPWFRTVRGFHAKSSVVPRRHRPAGRLAVVTRPQRPGGHGGRGGGNHAIQIRRCQTPMTRIQTPGSKHSAMRVIATYSARRSFFRPTGAPDSGAKRPTLTPVPPLPSASSMTFRHMDTQVGRPRGECSAHRADSETLDNPGLPSGRLAALQAVATSRLHELIVLVVHQLRLITPSGSDRLAQGVLHKLGGAGGGLTLFVKDGITHCEYLGFPADLARDRPSRPRRPPIRVRSCLSHVQVGGRCQRRLTPTAVPTARCAARGRLERARRMCLSPRHEPSASARLGPYRSPDLDPGTERHAARPIRGGQPGHTATPKKLDPIMRGVRRLLCGHDAAVFSISVGGGRRASGRV